MGVNINDATRYYNALHSATPWENRSEAERLKYYERLYATEQAFGEQVTKFYDSPNGPVFLTSNFIFVMDPGNIESSVAVYSKRSVLSMWVSPPPWVLAKKDSYRIVNLHTANGQDLAVSMAAGFEDLKALKELITDLRNSGATMFPG